MNISRPSIAFILAACATAACSANTKSVDPGSTGSSAQALSSPSIFHSTQTGGNAEGSVSHYDPNTQASYWLNFDAWENQSAQGRTASLAFWGYGYTTEQVCYDETLCSSWDYYTWTCNAWETVHWCYEQPIPYWIMGYGDIPTNDFRVGGHTAHLTTDLSNDAGFYATRCGWDANWSYSCTPITGTIDVTWSDNGLYSNELQGVWSSTSTSPWGSFSTRSIGHSTTLSADVSGTFLGDAPSTFGKIGSSMGTSITKDVFNATSDAGAPPPPSDAGPDGL